MKRFKYTTIAVATLIFCAGIVLCLRMASTKQLTNSESLLVGVFVSLLSILASWLISHVYAELSVQAAREDALANLRTYALKAAEKVTNLSNELGKLAGYLQAELDDNTYACPESDLQGKNERIQSAIHVLHTLKSVNDGSLSDWGGVIGDELKTQRELEEEREEELAELAGRVDHLSAAIDGKDAREDIERLRREFRSIAINIGGRALLPAPRPRPRKEEVSIRCPACEGTVTYKQRAKTRSFKVVECATCKGTFVSRYDDAKASFVLEPRHQVDEKINCPYCGVTNTVPLDNMPGTAVTAACKSCGLRIRVTRDAAHGARGLKIANELAKIPAQPLTDELLRRVEDALPAQPWPTAIHRKIATELSLSDSTVTSAIAALIERGKFLHQFGGKLFKETTVPNDNGNGPASAAVGERQPAEQQG
jgi:DNA-directed RNA polymerase subunit RPC12/RpoP